MVYFFKKLSIRTSHKIRLTEASYQDKKNAGNCPAKEVINERHFLTTPPTALLAFPYTVLLKHAWICVM